MNTKVQKNEFGEWEVIDTRFNKVVKTCDKGSKAAAYQTYYEAELKKAEENWK